MESEKSKQSSISLNTIEEINIIISKMEEELKPILSYTGDESLKDVAKQSPLVDELAFLKERLITLLKKIEL